VKRQLFRSVAIVTLAVLTSCATIIHPERKGNRGGAVDVVPLVVDILLFIPGLIPGLIAIIVDFGTGAIYTGGGSAEVHDVGRRGTLAGRTRDQPAGTVLHMRLLDADGTVLDADRTDASDVHRRVGVNLAEAARAHRGEADVPLTLEIQIDERPASRVLLVMR
jgi:hypothetical protein